MHIKQHSYITYAGCAIDEKISGEVIALKVIPKTNSIFFSYSTYYYPSYLNEFLQSTCLNNSKTRNNYLNLIFPFKKTQNKKWSLSLFTHYKKNQQNQYFQA